ncbi:MAG: lysophospholipid acyltransferase family protein [Flavobacteriaceae bacterium]
MKRFVTWLRVGLFLLGTLAVAPVQRVVILLGARRAFLLPLIFHRMTLRVLGIRVRFAGEQLVEGPALLVSNHVSWLDIPVIGAIAPLVFVAKDDVSSWPGFGWLAKLQYTVFVARERRTRTMQDGGAIGERLQLGDRAVLFAEGTSSDGNRVLPFKSSLVGAVLAGRDTPVRVQPMALVYTGRAGLPLLRRERPFVCWYGDMTLVPHLLHIFSSPPLDVTIAFGPVMEMAGAAERKQVTAAAHAFVAGAAMALRNGQQLDIVPSYSKTPSDGLSHAEAAA